MARINIDELAFEAQKELKAFGNITAETVTKAVNETAKETVQELHRISPKGPTGDYARSWSYERDPSSKHRDYSMVVYSKDPDYRLTHLLENGHAIATGGRVEAVPHIGRAERIAISLLENKLSKNL